MANNCDGSGPKGKSGTHYAFGSVVPQWLQIPVTEGNESDSSGPPPLVSESESEPTTRNVQFGQPQSFDISTPPGSPVFGPASPPSSLENLDSPAEFNYTAEQAERWEEILFRDEPRPPPGTPPSKTGNVFSTEAGSTEYSNTPPVEDQFHSLPQSPIASSNLANPSGDATELHGDQYVVDRDMVRQILAMLTEPDPFPEPVTEHEPVSGPSERPTSTMSVCKKQQFLRANRKVKRFIALALQFCNLLDKQLVNDTVVESPGFHDTLTYTFHQRINTFSDPPTCPRTVMAS